MKRKLLLFAAFAVLFACGQANANNIVNNTVFGAGHPDLNQTNYISGQGFLAGDGSGRVMTYIKPDEAGNFVDVDGWRFIWNAAQNSYTYAFVSYNNRSAANETRQIAAITSEAEARILGNRVAERAEAALTGSSDAGLGVFAMGRNGMTSGMNAGANMNKLGIWAMYSFTHIRNDGFVDHFRGNLHTGLFGVDYMFTNCFLAGIAFQYGHINDADYKIRDGKYEHDSFTTALYAALIAHEFISFDAYIGYGHICKEFKERQVLAIDTRTNTVFLNTNEEFTGCTQAHRFIGSFFANVRYTIEMLKLWLRFGYSHRYENEDGFNVCSNTSNTVLRRPGGTINFGNLGGRLRVAYRVEKMFEPYIQGGINYDVVDESLNVVAGPGSDLDRFGWMVGGGLRLFGFMDNLSGGVQYTFNQRGDTDFHHVTVDIRYDF